MPRPKVKEARLPFGRIKDRAAIETDPCRLGEGLAAAVTSALCQDLLPTVDLIVLNVKHDNQAAIRCNEGLGFEA